MKTHFLTYATNEFMLNATILADSAKRVGFNSSIILNQSDIIWDKFYKDNAQILNMPRGAGYWLWKPYIILEALKRLGPDDCLFYSDAGRSQYYAFRKFPEMLFGRLLQTKEGFLLGPAISHLGTIKEWTKRDCLHLMDADEPALHKKPLLMTWGLWRNTPDALNFLKLWLDFCRDSRCLTDQPNELGLGDYPAFIDHRHDQSIMSILAHKTGAPFLDFSNTLVHRGILLRPNSELGHVFYKRPENSNDLLRFDNPWILLREFFRLKSERIIGYFDD